MVKFINFFSSEDSTLGEPTPIKKLIPEWYRQSESDFVDDRGENNAGLKKCMPYMDILISGYAITTPFDIFVKKKEDGSLDISWNGPDDLSAFIGERPKQLGALMPRPEGHLPNHLVWKGFWGVKTPKGYSLLFTHPFNRYDLPFTTLSAIVDSDEFSAPGNIPFFLKDGFTGTIPAGTPIVQLIPVKRQSWKMTKSLKWLKDRFTAEGLLVRKDETPYKKIMWHRKEYN